MDEVGVTVQHESHDGGRADSEVEKGLEASIMIEKVGMVGTTNEVQGIEIGRRWIVPLRCIIIENGEAGVGNASHR